MLPKSCFVNAIRIYMYMHLIKKNIFNFKIVNACTDIQATVHSLRFLPFRLKHFVIT